MRFNSQTTIEKSCLEFLQRNCTWASAEVLNSSIGNVDLHYIYGCTGHDLQWNIQCCCENKCNNKCTPLINPSKWTLMYCCCSVTWTWIPSRSCIRWRWRYRRLMVLSQRLWIQTNRLKGLCVTLYLIHGL